MQHCLELLRELVPGGRSCLDLLSSDDDLMGLPPQKEIHQTRQTQRDIDQEAQTLKDKTRAADDQAGNYGVQDKVPSPETLQQLEFERLKANGGAHLQPSLKTEPGGRTAVGGKLGKMTSHSFTTLFSLSTSSSISPLYGCNRAQSLRKTELISMPWLPHLQIHGVIQQI